ncbi:hypothetical protein GQ55_5G129700 [Panicum hallii var. hallii]|uniref:Uncharacterized protein n=1 Tax=Panicum hallii var. hallii TaxID=1504633 RepID=A0A2T7DFQ7_9POAL|nr:hypothetical protein GQ55_5G129700 [Panicum hallii var. hallii]
MLTRQPNPRTSVEVREDTQEPAASSHASLCPESFATAAAATVAQAPPAPCCSPSPPWPGAPQTHRWRGRWPRHRLWGPSRTSSPLALDSSLAGAGGAEDRSEASTRLTCAVSGSDEQLARAIILVPGFGGKARRSCSCQKQ